MVKALLKIIHFFILLLFLIIQIVLLEQFSFYGTGINLLFVAVIAVSIIDGYIYGILYGFAFGMILDILSGGIIGLNALVFTLAAFLAYRVYRLGFKPRLLTYLIIVPLVTVLDVLLPNLIYYAFGYGIRPAFLFISLFLQPAINAVLVLGVFPLMRTGSIRKEEIGFLYKKKI